MLQHTKINGRPAVVAYLDNAFEPVDESAATLVKVVFTDDEGGIAFLKAETEAMPDARTQLEKEWDESKHPRDEGGKFGHGGGGGAKDKEEGDGGAKGTHPGPGYSKAAKLIDGVIHTPNVYDAQRALTDDRRVNLTQPKGISTLVMRLGEVAKKMVAEGKKEPNFNLCNVTVTGSNLFCADTKGIKRINMPQMDEIQTKAFRKHLKDKGYEIEKGEERSANLRATQNELIGTKVSKGYARMKEKGEKVIDQRLIISKDDYILDGHHRWAAQIAVDAEDGKLNNGHKIKVSRVNIGITELLELANKFTGGKGAVAGTI